MKRIFVALCALLTIMIGCGYATTNTVTESVDSWSGNIIRTTDNPWVSIGSGSILGSSFRACLDARITIQNEEIETCVMILNVRNTSDWVLSAYDALVVRAGEKEIRLEPISGHHSHDCSSTGYGAFSGMLYSERNEYSITPEEYRSLGLADSLDVRFSNPGGTYVMFAMPTELFQQSLLDSIPPRSSRTRRSVSESY